MRGDPVVHGLHLPLLRGVQRLRRRAGQPLVPDLASPEPLLLAPLRIPGARAVEARVVAVLAVVGQRRVIAEPARLAVLVDMVEEDGHHEVSRRVIKAGVVRQVRRVTRPDAGATGRALRETASALIIPSGANHVEVGHGQER